MCKTCTNLAHKSGIICTKLAHFLGIIFTFDGGRWHRMCRFYSFFGIADHRILCHFGTLRYPKICQKVMSHFWYTKGGVICGQHRRRSKDFGEYSPKK